MDCSRKYIKPDANLAEALAHCTISNEPADWYTDTGASAHMTTDASQLDKVEPYTGKDKVIVGNGSSNILKEPLHFGLKITPSTTFNISAFSDANWAGYPDTS
jgi:hypothetical protein